MKILHIKAPDCTWETHARFVDLVCALASLGITQQIVMDHDRAAETIFTELKIPVMTGKFSGLFDLRTQKTVREITDTFAPHIIQTHSPGAGSAAAKIIERTLCVGFTVPDPEQNSKSRAVNHMLLEEMHHTQTKPMHFNVLPVPPLVRPPGASGKNSTLELPAGKTVLGTLAGLEPHNDLETLFAALRDISGVHFLLTGKGASRPQLEERIRKHAVHDKVTFAPPEWQWPQIASCLDIALVPRQKGNCDRATLQSWAAGLCVISGNPAGHSPVTDKQDGMLVADNGIPRWREIINALLADKTRRRALAEAGHKTYHTLYDEKKVVLRYLQAYETALKIQI